MLQITVIKTSIWYCKMSLQSKYLCSASFFLRPLYYVSPLVSSKVIPQVSDWGSPWFSCPIFIINTKRLFFFLFLCLVNYLNLGLKVEILFFINWKFKKFKTWSLNLLQISWCKWYHKCHLKKFAFFVRRLNLSA